MIYTLLGYIIDIIGYVTTAKYDKIKKKYKSTIDNIQNEVLTNNKRRTDR